MSFINCSYKKYLIIITSVLLIYISSIFLIFLGINVNIIKQISGIVLLTILPGATMIRFLNIKNLMQQWELLILVVGLSLSLIMLLGFLVNHIFLYVGFKNPLSSPVIITTFILFIYLTALLAGFLNKDDVATEKHLTYYQNSFININALIKLTMFILPFLSVAGSYIFNLNSNCNVNLIVIFIISLLPCLACYAKDSNTRCYIVFFASLAVLYNFCFISNHVWGWDIHIILHAANQTLSNNCWEASKAFLGNDLLVMTILPTIYTLVTGIDVVWVIKLIYPLFFSFVPVGIYLICKKIFGNTYISVLSPFVFVFFYGFFKAMPSKQLIAELFVVIIFMLIIYSETNKFDRKFILIFVTFGLVTTHYGVCFYFLFVIAFVFAVKKIANLIKNEELIDFNFIIYLSVLSMAWFMFNSGGVHFESIVNIAINVFAEVMEIFKSPPLRSGVGYASREMPNIFWVIYKFFNIILQIFIFIGLIFIIKKLFKKNKNYEYLNYVLYSIVFYLLLIASVVMTFGMGFDRILQINLLFLSSCAIIGGYYFFYCCLYCLKPIRLYLLNYKVALKSLCVFLIIYFLFSSGFLFKVTSSQLPSYAISLDKNNWNKWHAYNDSEINGAKWMKNNVKNKPVGIESKNKKCPGIIGNYYNYKNIKFYNGRTNNIKQNVYLYTQKSDSLCENMESFASRVYSNKSCSVFFNITKE